VTANKAKKADRFCRRNQGGELIFCMRFEKIELRDRYLSHNSLSVVSRDLASLCNKNLS
jgi:hypothetical protein